MKAILRAAAAVLGVNMALAAPVAQSAGLVQKYQRIQR